MKKQARPFPRYHVLVLIILTGVLGLLGIRLLTESEYGSLGTTDLIQYWSAASLLIDGKDPYNPELLQAVQQDLGRTQSEPLRMWHPPWLLVTLLPVLSFDFGLSTVLWLTINLASSFFPAASSGASLGAQPGRACSLPGLPAFHSSLFFCAGGWDRPAAWSCSGCSFPAV